MTWNNIILVSALIFFAGIIIAPFRFKYKKDKFFTPFKIIFTGTFVSAISLFLPVYLENFKNHDHSFWISLFSSLQHTFRLFALDGEYLGFVEVAENVIGNEPTTLSLYIILCTALYLVAPILTFTFLLLMLKNFIALVSYRCVLWWKETHVFSELNDKSVALAKSIIEREIGDSFLKRISKLFRKDIIVFTDVIADKEELTSDLIDEAKKLGAILFYKDIESLNIAKSYTKRNVKIYLISENENEKIKQANHIMKNYDFPGIELYVFSESTQSQIILRHKKVENIKVVRVNDIRTLIYHNLDTYGMRLFEKAYNNNSDKKSKNSTISAVIVGFGRYGKEMLKALAWFCQYPKFNLVINVFDSDPKAEDYFKFHFPGMDNRRGTTEKIDNFKIGEDNYTINFHSGIDVNSPEFKKKFDAIDNPTYIFVCLGSDEDNINAALNIRTLCESRGLSINKVDVETVVYDSHSAELMGCIWDLDKTPVPLYDTVIDKENAIVAAEEKAAKIAKAEAKKNRARKPKASSPSEKNVEKSSEELLAEKEKRIKDEESRKKNTYGIHIIGDLDSFYSCDTIVDPQWEYAGMVVNRRYFVQHLKAEKAELAERLSDRAITEVIADTADVENPDTKELMKEKAESDKAADKGFWQKEYNYRSSVTKAIHEKLKLKLHQFTDYGIVLDELKNPPKIIEEWEDEKIFEYSKLEHPRWCAYLRSEGYVKRTDGGDGRNELAKTHSDLIPTEELAPHKKFYDL